MVEKTLMPRNGVGAVGICRGGYFFAPSIYFSLKYGRGAVPADVPARPYAHPDTQGSSDDGPGRHFPDASPSATFTVAGW